MFALIKPPPLPPINRDIIERHLSSKGDDIEDPIKDDEDDEKAAKKDPGPGPDEKDDGGEDDEKDDGDEDDEKDDGGEDEKDDGGEDENEDENEDEKDDGGEDENEDEDEDEDEGFQSTTEKKLLDVIGELRTKNTDINYEECIRKIENVINLKATNKELNDPEIRKRIESHKDRLMNDLRVCHEAKIRKKKEEERKEEEKRRKAQEEFDLRLEQKYGLREPKGTPPSQSTQINRIQPSQQMESQTDSQSLSSSSVPGQMEQNKGKKEEGIMENIKSYLFGEDKEDGITNEEMADAINLYLKSQDPKLQGSINMHDVKGVDNLIQNFEELVENHEILEDRFQRYKSAQEMVNFQDDTTINEQKETIDHLSTILSKLEKTLETYKKNAEKKFIAQNEIKEQEIKRLINEKESESREIHRYMQDILNEKIDKANYIIKKLSEQTDHNIEEIDTISKQFTPLKKGKKTDRKEKRSMKVKKSKKAKKSKKDGKNIKGKNEKKKKKTKHKKNKNDN